MIADVHDRYPTPGNWRHRGPTLEGMNVYYATDTERGGTIADHHRTLAGNP